MNGQMLYAWTTPEAGKLFLKDVADDAAPEAYRFGESNFDVTDIDARGSRIACAVSDAYGEYHIALFEEERAGYRWLTQGDTRDSAPWLSGEGDHLYYASVGIARNEEGWPIAFGPSSVQCLSIGSGTLQEVCGDAETDYLRPKQGPDGALYMIVRPYKQPEASRKTLADRVKSTKDFFRGIGMIVKAVKNTGDQRSSQVTAGAGAAAQTRMLNGQMVNIAAPADEGEETGCAPENWVLMRREADGSLTQVQKGVADYAFDGQRLIYTNGRCIFAVENGKRQRLYRGGFVPRIALL